eukprot:571532-Hanusia_phi.AAC.8
MVRCPCLETAEKMTECIKVEEEEVEVVVVVLQEEGQKVQGLTDEQAARADEDSVGGVVSCVIRNVPIGLGEPCFDKLEVCPSLVASAAECLQAVLAHAMMSIPATKGFEIGSGFAGARMRGSQHNDMFTIDGRRR